MEVELHEAPTTVVVVAGGDPPDLRLAGFVPAGAYVIAADSGADHALRLGLTVDHLVGDLDSVSTRGRAEIEAGGARTSSFPADKDYTDLELALCEARRLDPTTILVIGGNGGRLDHALAGLALLAAPWLAPAGVRAWHGEALVTVVRARQPVAITGPVGSTVSLIPVLANDARGVGPVTTAGLRFALHAEQLQVASSRGVSNEMISSRASVTVEHGVLLVVQPHALEGRNPEEGIDP